MSARSHYERLGVSQSATPSEIKRAYLDLARKLHPDVSSSSDDEFAAVSHAYDVLKDPLSRRAYDSTLNEATTSAGTTRDAYANWRRDVNTNWRRAPSRDGRGRERANSYGFDEDEDEDWTGNTAWTTAEIERRAAEERRRARAKADAARWWKHERLAAERRRREFRERDASATMRRSERHVSKIADLWATRAGVVWQDVVALGVGCAALAYGGSRFLAFARPAPTPSAREDDAP